MEFTGAIFDMDGTLIDSLWFWDILWEKLGEDYLSNKDFKPSKEDDKLVRTMLLVDAMNLIHRNYKIGKTGEEVFNYTRNLIKWFYGEKVKLKNGVYDYLLHLKNKGVKMCIASASEPDFIGIALKNCGIDEFFSKIISCANVGKGKEEPDVFLKALEYLGTDIYQTVVVEDSLIAIKTAKKAGFKTIGVYDKNNFGHAEMKKIANEYIDNGESLLKLI